MENNSPYTPPQADLQLPPEYTALASRWARLGAAILDGLLLAILLSPLMYFGGYFAAVMEAAQSGQEVAFGYVLMWSAVGFAGFVAVQAYPLSRWGQTWGKRAVGIRIADMQGNKPSLSVLLYRRYLPVQAVNVVPIIGPILGLVDTLFIFREDKRCIHDLIAGTQVVAAH